MAFPDATPSYAASDNTMTLNEFGHLTRHTDMQTDIIGLSNKLGTGASAPATGKILRGTGAGVSAWSTPTFPNTATSGKVLIGDGTDVVLSTPAFPNVSATTRKIIVSDGTDWVASDETYAEPGASGEILKSDGTNWVSANDSVYSSYEGKRYIINNPYRDGGAVHLKGQMHGHTTNSDGADTASAYMTAYKNAGYDFATITDHDYITADPAVAGITWLCASVEESTGRHVVAYDVTDQTTAADVQTVINFHRNQNRMVDIPHPSWTGHYIINESDMDSYYNFNFTEVFNRTVNEYADAIWDYALSSGKKTFAFAVDDCHSVTTATYFDKGWIVVHATANTADAIKTALRIGNFYASTGNDIAIALTGNVVTASSAGSSNFTFYGRNGRVLKTENAVTSSVYTILGNEMYVRVKSVKVADSLIAWSQPVFVDVIGDDDERLSRINTGIWTDYVPDVVGFSSEPGNSVYRYTQVGKTVKLLIRNSAVGVSNATSFTISLPIPAKTITYALWTAPADCDDNSAVLDTPSLAYISSGGTTVVLTPTYNSASTWTASGNKRCRGCTITYEVE